MRYNTILLLFAFKMTGVLMLGTTKRNSNRPIIKRTNHMQVLKFPLPKTDSWDDGEVPWDIRNDNFTYVSIMPLPIYPAPPSSIANTFVYKI
jgi:hypothetical protein